MALSDRFVDPTNFTVLNTAPGHAVEYVNGTPYVGPVNWLTTELIYAGIQPSLSVSAWKANSFIRTGSGDDAINTTQSRGDCVLDGGTGSNFLVGAGNHDVFFVDDRDATAPVWSTIGGFHQGDSLTVWGVTPKDFTLTWLDDQGANGYKGLTLSAQTPNRPDASVTLIGLTKDDLTTGKLHVSFGTTEPSNGTAGSAYMQIT